MDDDSRSRLRLSRAAQALLLASVVFAIVVLVMARTGGGSSRAAANTGGSGSTATTGAATVGPTGVSAPLADSNEGAIQAPDPELVSAAASVPIPGRFQLPLRAWSKVTDRYGAPRAGGLVHGGIDLGLEGMNHSTVYSACTGSVDTTGYSSSYGNNVVVDCGGGFSTLYGHLSSILVKAGEAVDNTVAVGISGSTGYSTGEHLHFEIRYRGTPVNPENYLDFHIAPGTPLSDGPIWFPGSAAASAAPTATATALDPTATATATATPTFTPTPTPTSTPTPTPTPKAVRKTPTPPPVLR